MGFTYMYGSMVFSLAFLAPGGGLAITRNMISIETTEAPATVLEDLLARQQYQLHWSNLQTNEPADNKNTEDQHVDFES